MKERKSMYVREEMREHVCEHVCEIAFMEHVCERAYMRTYGICM